jgi:hypothetical protein
MLCYFQFLIKDLARRLGAQGNTGAIREHPFFESIDCNAVEEKCMEPQIKEVSSAGSVFIFCHKLLLKLHVQGGSNSLD